MVGGGTVVVVDTGVELPTAVASAAAVGEGSGTAWAEPVRQREVTGTRSVRGKGIASYRARDVVP